MQSGMKEYRKGEIRGKSKKKTKKKQKNKTKIFDSL